MDLEQLSRNNEDKREPIHNNISTDNYEKFLVKKISTLENILKEKSAIDIEERILLSKIVAYQECYIQYLLYKK